MKVVHAYSEKDLRQIFHSSNFKWSGLILDNYEKCIKISTNKPTISSLVSKVYQGQRSSCKIGWKCENGLIWKVEVWFEPNLVYWYDMGTFICSCGQRSQIKVKCHLRSTWKIPWKCKFWLIWIHNVQHTSPINRTIFFLPSLSTYLLSTTEDNRELADSPVHEAFSYGIRHISLWFNEVWPYASLNDSEICHMPYPIWKCLTYGVRNLPNNCEVTALPGKYTFVWGSGVFLS